MRARMSRIRTFLRDPDVRRYWPALAVIFALYCVVGTWDYDAQTRVEQSGTQYAQR